MRRLTSGTGENGSPEINLKSFFFGTCVLADVGWEKTEVVPFLRIPVTFAENVVETWEKKLKTRGRGGRGEKVSQSEINAEKKLMMNGQTLLPKPRRLSARPIGRNDL